MRLFGRKQSEEDVEEYCPQCGEHVPRGAVECMMCGVDLRPFRADSSDDEPSSPSSIRPPRENRPT
jgi:hypothetical protein